MKTKTIAWACMFSDNLLDTMVGQDNQKLWNPLAIFKDPLEAARWRKEKYLGDLDNTKIVKVEIKLEDNN